ncbi:hypothetical protein [Fulvivirga sedimenti]|uniref:Uncharacterized protein n=1 Tax=Fulvivirga sedimenti TaxID=2879465 RepID=A0A9X1KXD1_9BACT|nr:hypothetical protein [Fulvivirga sedimenti]MCA6074593.1 hypothetical protein [Fulvivirga sedimenti]MCA6075770.1 hypothetical protein [Fulvivirga sedimenti]MCA6076898.1 hypothetical protein [Fulvivirga sedimenti]
MADTSGFFKRILFIPASGPKGSGEYIRSLNIANHINSRFPSAHIQFLLSRQSPASETCPYSAVMLPDTPTFCTTEVKQAIADYKPDLVIFDATGRSSQLRLAKKSGARTVFIAQNSAILNRALGLLRLGFTDEIWIVQPEYVLPLSGWNALKARLFHQTVVHTGPVFPVINPEKKREILDNFTVLKEKYILCNPGGGGHEISGVPAVKLFEDAAKRIHRQSGLPVVFVYGQNYTGELLDQEGITGISKLSPEAFHVAISQSTAFLSGGGGAVFQAMAEDIPCVAVALSADQEERIRKAMRKKNILTCKADPENMADTVLKALGFPPAGIMDNDEILVSLDIILDRLIQLTTSFDHA